MVAGLKRLRCLREFPVAHAMQSEAVKTMAAEFTSFNTAMKEFAPALSPSVPVSIVHCMEDTTARPGWHVPCLLRHMLDWECTLLSSCGHAVHHDAPQVVVQSVLCRSDTAFRLSKVSNTRSAHMPSRRGDAVTAGRCQNDVAAGKHGTIGPSSGSNITAKPMRRVNNRQSCLALCLPT